MLFVTPLRLRTPDTNSRITVTHRLVFPVTVFTALLGNFFQLWTFLCSRSHVLAGWRPSHTNLLLLYFRRPKAVSRLTGLSYRSLWHSVGTEPTENIFSCSCCTIVWRGSCDVPTENTTCRGCFVVVWGHCCRRYTFIVSLPSNVPRFTATSSVYIYTWRWPFTGENVAHKK
jgi:hypothetical protein